MGVTHIIRKIEENSELVTKLEQTLTKNPNRKFNHTTLVRKLQFARSVSNNSKVLVEQLRLKLPQEQLDGYLLKINTKFDNISVRVKNLMKYDSKNCRYFKSLVFSVIFVIKLKYFATMVKPLDLGIALKIVEKFSGESLELGHFIETLDLLKTYSAEVAEGDILVFLKTRLVGSAHGAIEGAATLEAAKQALRDKFAVKLTPTACEAELKLASQRKLSISDYGKQVEQLAARLATAHVSTKTFPNEAAADAIVQPAAVNAFISGLSNPQTAFFVRARNPPTLNRAISDALEVLPAKEEVHWFQPHSSGSYGRGRGGRGFNSQRHFRGRNNSQNRNNGNGYNNNNNNYQSQRGAGRGRGNRGQFRGNNNNNNNNHNNRRGNNHQHACNCAQTGQEREGNVNQQNQPQEEAHTLQELFRE